MNSYAEANNITLVGGSSASVVAAGGWIAGGGHSALSNTLGLGVDRAIEFQVVVPSGRLLTVRAISLASRFEICSDLSDSLGQQIHQSRFVLRPTWWWWCDVWSRDVDVYSRRSSDQTSDCFLQIRLFGYEGHG